jgi:hypothetical protein
MDGENVPPGHLVQRSLEFNPEIELKVPGGQPTQVALVFAPIVEE